MWHFDISLPANMHESCLLTSGRRLLQLVDFCLPPADRRLSARANFGASDKSQSRSMTWASTANSTMIRGGWVKPGLHLLDNGVITAVTSTPDPRVTRLASKRLSNSRMLSIINPRVRQGEIYSATAFHKTSTVFIKFRAEIVLVDQALAKRLAADELDTAARSISSVPGSLTAIHSTKNIGRNTPNN